MRVPLLSLLPQHEEEDQVGGEEEEEEDDDGRLRPFPGGGKDPLGRRNHCAHSAVSR